jgi:hypothetical protein
MKRCNEPLAVAFWIATMGVLLLTLRQPSRPGEQHVPRISLTLASQNP